MTQDTACERTADDARLEALANTLADQRNTALDLIASLRGELAAKDFDHARQVDNLQTQIAELVDQLAKSRARKSRTPTASPPSPA